MANTIGTGFAGAIPFYDAAGTDLVQTPGGVSYDKTNKILSIPGFSINKPVYTGGYGFSGMSFQNFYAGQPVNSFNFVRGRGSFSAKAVPQSGDQLANIVIAGWGGSSPVVGANIKAVLVGTANTTSMPTDLVFSTNNGTALADRAKLTKDGQLQVNSIANFSGNDLTLSPTGRVVLGEPSKVKITGGTSGQAIVTDGNGNLSWATISGTQGPKGDTGDTGATGLTGPTGPTGAPGGALGTWTITVSGSSSTTLPTPTAAGEIRANGTGYPSSLTTLKLKCISTEGSNTLAFANAINAKTGRLRIQVKNGTGFSYYTFSATSDFGSGGGVLTLGLVHLFSTSGDWDGSWANKTVTISIEGGF